MSVARTHAHTVCGMHGAQRIPDSFENVPMRLQNRNKNRKRDSEKAAVITTTQPTSNYWLELKYCGCTQGLQKMFRENASSHKSTFVGRCDSRSSNSTTTCSLVKPHFFLFTPIHKKNQDSEMRSLVPEPTAGQIFLLTARSKKNSAETIISAKATLCCTCCSVVSNWRGSGYLSRDKQLPEFCPNLSTQASCCPALPLKPGVCHLCSLGENHLCQLI